MQQRQVDVRECNIIYNQPSEIRLTHGMSSVFAPLDTAYFHTDAEEMDTRLHGRVHIGLNGVKCVDKTRQRLLVFCEASFATVPLICGCSLRDNKRYERAHIPLFLAPSNGIEYVFRDDTLRNMITLTIDGTFWGYIDTTKRTKFDDVWWLEGTFE